MSKASPVSLSASDSESSPAAASDSESVSAAQLAVASETVTVSVTVPPSTPRIEFQRWSRSSCDMAFAKQLYTDERVMSLVGGILNEEQLAARLQSELTNEATLGVQYWRLHRRDRGGEFIGVCGLKPRMVPAVDRYEFGFYLVPEAQGQGLAAEAGKAVIAHALAPRSSGGVGARELFAKHHPRNDASGGALKKLGFTPAGEEFYEPTGLMHPAYCLSPSTKAS